MPGRPRAARARGERRRRPRAPSAAASGMPWTFPVGLVAGRVEVAVRVDPDRRRRAGRPRRGGRPASRARSSGRRRARAGATPSATTSRTIVASRAHASRISGRKRARSSVDAERLRLRGRDVPAIDDRAAERREALLEPRVADRGRAHVDAASRPGRGRAARRRSSRSRGVAATAREATRLAASSARCRPAAGRWGSVRHGRRARDHDVERPRRRAPARSPGWSRTTRTTRT